MRVRASGNPELEAFDKWTLAIGNGSMSGTDTIIIPPEMCFNIDTTTFTSKIESMNKFCDEIFPGVYIFCNHSIILLENSELKNIRQSSFTGKFVGPIMVKFILLHFISAWLFWLLVILANS